MASRNLDGFSVGDNNKNSEKTSRCSAAVNISSAYSGFLYSCTSLVCTCKLKTDSDRELTIAPKYL